MFEPLKTAFGRCVMEPFFKSLVATTRPMFGYVKKPFKEACLIAPSRMVDAALEMLDKYQRLDWDEPTKPHSLPVMMYGFARDYTPTGRDYTRQIADGEWVQLPDDPKERIFRVRTVSGDVRAQVVFFASDEPTARSMAAQFLLFLDSTAARRYMTKYWFAGFWLEWPVQIESPELPAVQVQVEADNLVILAVDLTLKATVPLFSAPKEGEENDGKGTPGDPKDPAGYPVTVLFDVNKERRVQ